MSTMSSRNRARLLWLLAAVTAAYALVNVVVYYATGRFGEAWFATSLVVYGTLLVVALALAITDTGGPAAARASDATPARLVGREVLYTTRSHYLLRLTYLHPDGRRDARLFLSGADESAPLLDALAQVDALPPATPNDRLASDVDAALQARASSFRQADSASPQVIP